MNEELQSTNEELETVNEELRQRGSDLSRNNVFLSGILRSVPLAVIVLDEHLQVELWNHVAADLWGLRADEAEGANLLNLGIGLPVAALRQPVRKALNGDAGNGQELTLGATNRKGRSIQCRVVCAPLVGRDAGAADGVILIIEEVDGSAAGSAGG
jgi:two-component system CheB/CheR fusion protein